MLIIQESITTENGFKIVRGTEIYYTGDMANHDGFGRASKIYSTEWGIFMTLRLEDGRVFPHVGIRTFTGPRRRFMTVKERNEARAIQLEKMAAMRVG